MEENFTVKDASIKNGIILGLISIVLTLVSNMFALYEDSTFRIVLMVLGIGLTIYFFVAAHNTFKKNNGGYMTLGQGIGIGTLMSVVSSILSAIFSYVYVKFIDDAPITFAMEESIRSMEERGMDQTAIDQSMGFMEALNSAEAQLGLGIFFGILFGFIIALIISLFTKKADPSLEF